MLIVLLAISFKSRSSRVVPLWSKLSINPNELAEREERVSRKGDTTVVAPHHHASEHVGRLGPTLLVANLDIARHKDIVQQAEAQKFHCVEQQFS